MAYHKRLIGVALAVAALCLTGASAAPKKPAAKPKTAPAVALDPNAVIARLQKDQAKITAGRLSLHAVTRKGELPEKATVATAWERARTHPIAAQSRDYFIFSSAGWKRDITTMDGQSNPTAHYLLGVGKEAPRILEETGHADQAKRIGTIGLEPQQNAADRLLMGRGADLLEGAKWKTAKKQGAGLVVTGERGDERLTVHLRTAPYYSIERLLSEEKLLTPVGNVSRGQELIIQHNLEKGLLAPKSIQHLIYVGEPQNQVLYANYKVEGAQLNSALKPDELRVEFPQGTAITDRRVDPPLRYNQGEKDLTLAELKAMVDAKSETSAQVGKPAPNWEVKSLDGKTVKNADYKGRVLLLTWFASWCGPCHAEAPRMEAEIWQKYRGKGLTVLGVNTAERQDPVKMAGDFVKQHSLTYPVLLDTDEILSQAYQIEVLPTVAIIDRKGVLRYLQRGFREADVIQQIEALVAEP
jgi:peroxiredoxin